MGANGAELQQVYFDALKLQRVIERVFRGYMALGEPTGGTEGGSACAFARIDLSLMGVVYGCLRVAV